MALTKAEYIQMHAGKLLAQKLAENDWPPDCQIKLVTGTPSLGPRSALRKELQGTTGEYVVGHPACRRKTSGMVIAVRL